MDVNMTSEFLRFLRYESTKHLTAIGILGYLLVSCTPVEATPTISPFEELRSSQLNIIPYLPPTETNTPTQTAILTFIPTSSPTSTPLSTDTATTEPTFTSTPTETITPTPTAIPSCQENPASKVVFPPYIKYGPVNPNDKKIAVTIDDFWYQVSRPELTKQILDIAKETHSHFSFGPVGKVLRYNSDLWIRALNEGHEFFNHTFDHNNLLTLTSEKIQEDIDKTEEAYKKVFGSRYCGLRLIRAPGQLGIRDPRILGFYNSHNYSMLDWSISINGPTTFENIVNRALTDETHPKNIFLIHAVPDDIEHLKTIIEGFQNQGYRIVTMSELFMN